MPITLSGLRVTAPSFVIEIEEVFDASDERFAQRADVGSRLNARDDRALRIRAQSVFINVALQALVDRRHAARQKLLSHIAHHNVTTRTRRHLRNARAHCARSNYAQRFAHIFHGSIDFSLCSVGIQHAPKISHRLKSVLLQSIGQIH